MTADEPARLEFTIGVCVPMVWDADAGRYQPVGPLTVTDGGLFSDACEGAWNPDADEWQGNDTDERCSAHELASEIVGAVLPDAVQ